MAVDIEKLLLVMQLSDSQLPVGGFSFSSGLESAIYEGIVGDEKSLGEYVGSLLRSYLRVEGVIAMEAHRALERGDRGGVLELERKLLIRRVGDESREMILRMGRKLLQLGLHITPCKELSWWEDSFLQGAFRASHPIVMALLFHLWGLGEEALFTALGYGVVNPTLGASLRLMRISHYSTQRLLHDSAGVVRGVYEECRGRSVERGHRFSPELDIAASLHERGAQRLFMN